MQMQNIDEIPEQFNVDLEWLLTRCVEEILRNLDYERFRDWLMQAGPLLAPSFVAPQIQEAGEPQRMFSAFARHVWNSTPLPQENFRCKKISLPGRNDSCLCGSGKKFKHCCASREEFFQGDMELEMLPYVLRQIPVNELCRLEQAELSPHQILRASMVLEKSGDKKLGTQVVEAWLGKDRPLKDKDHICVEYLLHDYLEKPRKKETLLKRAEASDSKVLRSAALQTRVTILMDQGKNTRAWELFQEAQRLTPDDPGLGILEVTLLMSEGNPERAQERARFWLRRYEKIGLSEMEDSMLEWLQEIAENPAAGFLGIGAEQTPGLSSLMTLIQALPRPASHYRIELYGDLQIFSPDRAAQKLLAGWDKVCPQTDPVLTALYTSVDIFADADVWLPFLQANPAALDCVEVLDSLVLGLRNVAIPGVDDVLIIPLLLRGEQIVEQTLERCEQKNIEIPWVVMDNRPVLRLLSCAISDALDRDDEETALRGLRRILRLNPNDNHGWREWLVSLWLMRGAAAEALAVCDRYPHDWGGLEVDRALAQYLSGHIKKAEATLKAVYKKRKRMIDTLLDDKARKPREESASGGVQYGGAMEAWLFRERARPYWERSGGLVWAAEVLNKSR